MNVIVNRIRERIVITSTGCWEFQGSRNEKGYGRIKAGGKTYRVHRIMFEHHYGYDPLDKMICHSCDNPPCCNPEHLRAGTNSENQKEAYMKGRKNKKDEKGKWLKKCL